MKLYPKTMLALELLAVIEINLENPRTRTIKYTTTGMIFNGGGSIHRGCFSDKSIYCLMVMPCKKHYSTSNKIKVNKE